MSAKSKKIIIIASTAAILIAAAIIIGNIVSFKIKANEYAGEVREYLSYYYTQEMEINPSDITIDGSNRTAKVTAKGGREIVFYVYDTYLRMYDNYYSSYFNDMLSEYLTAAIKSPSSVDTVFAYLNDSLEPSTAASYGLNEASSLSDAAELLNRGYTAYIGFSYLLNADNDAHIEDMLKAIADLKAADYPFGAVTFFYADKTETVYIYHTLAQEMTDADAMREYVKSKIWMEEDESDFAYGDNLSKVQ